MLLPNSDVIALKLAEAGGQDELILGLDSKEFVEETTGDGGEEVGKDLVTLVNALPGGLVEDEFSEEDVVVCGGGGGGGGRSGDLGGDGDEICLLWVELSAILDSLEGEGCTGELGSRPVRNATSNDLLAAGDDLVMLALDPS